MLLLGSWSGNETQYVCEDLAAAGAKLVLVTSMPAVRAQEMDLVPKLQGAVALIQSLFHQLYGNRAVWARC